MTSQEYYYDGYLDGLLHKKEANSSKAYAEGYAKGKLHDKLLFRPADRAKVEGMMLALLGEERRKA